MTGSRILSNSDKALTFQKPGLLIPDLLPKEEPDIGAWRDALCSEVHYPVLPGSILTRLIVRMPRHIKGRTVWRTGVVLACDGNEALVKADLVTNRITIAVREPALGHREPLTRIREHLGGIHSSLVGLKVAEKVPVPGHPEIPPVDYKWLRELGRKGVPEFYPPGLTEPVNVRHLLDGVEVRGGAAAACPAACSPGCARRSYVAGRLMKIKKIIR